MLTFWVFWVMPDSDSLLSGTDSLYIAGSIMQLGIVVLRLDNSISFVI